MITPPPPLTATTEQGLVEFADAGSGEPVLVVHGSPGGYDQGWLMAQFLLEAGLRVIVPSRPGYLGTPLTDANASIDAQADTHAALLKTLGVQRCGVVCWSGGGPSSYRLAARHPARVTSLVAIAAVSRRYDWEQGAQDKIMFGTAVGNWLLRVLAAHRPEFFVSGTLSSEGDLDKETLDRLTQEIMADPVKRDFVLGLGLTVSYRGDRKKGVRNDEQTFAAIQDLQLGDITTPTLLVQGDADTDVVPAYTEFAASQLPNCETLLVEHGTHLAAFTASDSDAVQQRIVDFLRQG